MGLDCQTYQIWMICVSWNSWVMKSIIFSSKYLSFFIYLASRWNHRKLRKATFETRQWCDVRKRFGIIKEMAMESQYNRRFYGIFNSTRMEWVEIFGHQISTVVPKHYGKHLRSRKIRVSLYQYATYGSQFQSIRWRIIRTKCARTY